VKCIDRQKKEENTMIRKTVCLFFFALFFEITSCTSVVDSSMPPIETHPPAIILSSGETIFFPRQKKTEGERAVMDGEIDGTLVLVDNCIRIVRDDANISYLLIWPPDFDISIENDAIAILNESGEIVAHIGDMVHIGGGGINSLIMLDKYIQEQVPPQCTGSYWVVGDW
jgi:hypothetical protein